MSRQHRGGVTLPELLVVLGLIGMLLSMTWPALQRVRSLADAVGCASNLRQVGLALHGFHNDYGTLPVPTGARSNLSWMPYLLPYLEQNELWQATIEACRIEPNFTYMNPPHRPMRVVVRLFVRPLDQPSFHTRADEDGIEAAFTTYMGVSGGRSTRDGVMDQMLPVKFADIIDGLSNTFVVGERPPPESPPAGWWYSFAKPYGAWRGLAGPNSAMPIQGAVFNGDNCGGLMRFGPGRIDNPCDRYHFWSLHPGGGHFLFADNHVLFVSYRLSGEILIALASRNGQEAPFEPID